MLCDMCAGELKYLGVLGDLTWFRCRYCGYECSFHFDEELGDE